MENNTPKQKWYVKDYVVRINSMPVKDFKTLLEATRYVSDMGRTVKFQSELDQIVDIVKRKTDYKVVKSFKPSVATTLVVSNLDLDLIV